MVQNGIILTGYESGWFDWPDMHISIVLNGFHDQVMGQLTQLHEYDNAKKDQKCGFWSFEVLGWFDWSDIAQREKINYLLLMGDLVFLELPIWLFWSF